MEWLLIIEAAWSALTTLAVFAYFPNNPPTPPSPSAEAQNVVVGASKLLSDVKLLLRNPSFVLLAIIGGWEQGAFNSWTGMFDEILSPLHYTDTFSGWVGFGATIAGIVGGIAVG